MSKATHLLTIFILMSIAIGANGEATRAFRKLWEPAVQKCLHLLPKERKPSPHEDYAMLQCVLKETKVLEDDHYIDTKTDNEKAIITMGRTVDGCISRVSPNDPSEDEKTIFKQCLISAVDTLSRVYT